MKVALIGAELEENLAVRYLRGALEQAGHQVVQLVFNDAGQIESVAQALHSSAAPLAGLSMVFTWRAREFARLAQRSRELGYHGHIVAGGHFAAFNAQQLLLDVDAIDSVGCGEGEQLIVDLAARLDRLAEVDGLLWRKGTDLVQNQPLTKTPDLDQLAEPPRLQPFDEFVGLPITNILSSRGCRHGCAFCSIAAWHRLCGGDRYRARQPQCVAAEMARLYHRGVRLFNFHDDNFILSDPAQMGRRLDDLQRELDQRGVERIAYAIKARPDSVDERVFGRLKQMGLFRVFLGIEAGCDESLGKLGRGQRLSDNERALAIVNELDLHACFNLLLLNPDSNLAELTANVEFLRRHPDNPMNFCRTEIYAGTPWERRLRQQGRLLGDYWGYDYLIADPRAQAACEVMTQAFHTRNYGEHCLHHRAMHVDYERQLLAQFYGDDSELRTRVKQYIRTVNLNTCEHLSAILEAVAEGKLSRDRLEEMAERFRHLVETDNQRLLPAGDELLLEIRYRAAQRVHPSRGWPRKATVAAVAVTIGMSTAACDRDKLPMPEMVAPTTATGPVPMPEMVAPRPTPTIDGGLMPPTTDAGPPPPTTDGGTAVNEQKPLGDPQLVHPAFSSAWLPYLATQLQPARKTVIALWFDGQGKLARVQLQQPQLPEAGRERIEKTIVQWTQSIPAAAGKRFVLSYAAATLKSAIPRPVPRPVPRPEMIAPRPVPTPPPKVPYAEMIPEPTLDKKK